MWSKLYAYRYALNWCWRRWNFNFNIYHSHLLVNHKIVSLNFLLSSFVMGVTGIMFSLVFKYELQSSGAKILSHVDLYNLYISLHGIILIFLVLGPLLYMGIGYYLLPLTASNVKGFSAPIVYLLVLGYALLIYTLLGDFNTIYGWTLYTPLNTHSSVNLNYVLAAIILVAIALLVISAEFVLTPSSYNNIYVYSIYTTAIMIIFVWPVLFSIAILLLYDIYFTNSLFIIFQDPILYQHIFWFFGHPEVYVLIIPAFGLINQALGQVQNTLNIVSLICLGVLGNVVFGHHLFTVGLDVDNIVYFSVMSNVIAVPTSHKIINWIFMTKSCQSVQKHLAIIFILLFLFGALTGILMGNSALDAVLHDTFFIIAHFHFIMASAVAVIVVLSLSYVLQYEPVIIYAQLIFVFMSLIFLPLYVTGINLMPRRIHNYPDYVNALTYVSSLATYAVVFVLCAGFVEMPFNFPNCYYLLIFATSIKLYHLLNITYSLINKQPYI